MASEPTNRQTKQNQKKLPDRLNPKGKAIIEFPEYYDHKNMAGPNCGNWTIGHRANFSPKHQYCKPKYAPCSAENTKSFAKYSSAEQHINKHHNLLDHNYNHNASPN